MPNEFEQRNAYALVIVRKYLARLRSHPDFPEKRYPPEYFAGELAEDITALLEEANANL